MNNVHSKDADNSFHCSVHCWLIDWSWGMVWITITLRMQSILSAAQCIAADRLILSNGLNNVYSKDANISFHYSVYCRLIDWPWGMYDLNNVYSSDTETILSQPIIYSKMQTDPEVWTEKLSYNKKNSSDVWFVNLRTPLQFPSYNANHAFVRLYRKKPKTSPSTWTNILSCF
jgi:hypothetical protein